MYCKVCGNENVTMRLLSQNICQDCIDEITEISALEDNYDFYKNLIRILLGFYISENYQLNPVQ